MPIRITRRDFAALAGGFLVSPKAIAQTDTPLVTRAIPSSDERIPAVGLGTAYVFDQDDEATRSKADAVVQALMKGGGRLIDTASTYGDAESVLGKVTAAAGLRDKLFIATKLESPDAQELKRSLARLKTARQCVAPLAHRAEILATASNPCASAGHFHRQGDTVVLLTS